MATKEPTKADLAAAVAKLTEENAGLRQEIDALYDIFAAIKESPREGPWIVGYAGGIGNQGSSRSIRALHAYAADIRRGPRTVSPDAPAEPCPAFRIADDSRRWACVHPASHNDEDDAQRTVHVDRLGTEFRVARCRQPVTHGGMTRAWCAIASHHAPAFCPDRNGPAEARCCAGIGDHGGTEHWNVNGDRWPAGPAVAPVEFTTYSGPNHVSARCLQPAFHGRQLEGAVVDCDITAHHAPATRDGRNDEDPRQQPRLDDARAPMITPKGLQAADIGLCGAPYADAEGTPRTCERQPHETGGHWQYNDSCYPVRFSAYGRRPVVAGTVEREPSAVTA